MIGQIDIDIIIFLIQKDIENKDFEIIRNILRLLNGQEISFYTDIYCKLFSKYNDYKNNELKEIVISRIENLGANIICPFEGDNLSILKDYIKTYQPDILNSEITKSSIVINQFSLDNYCLQKNLKPFDLPEISNQLFFTLSSTDSSENNLYFGIKRLNRVELPNNLIIQINKLVQELLIILDNMFEFKVESNNGQKIRYLLIFILKFFKNFKNEGITKMTKNSIIDKVYHSLNKLSISSLTDDLYDFRKQLFIYSNYFKNKIYTRFSNATNDFLTSLANKVFEKITSIADYSSLQKAIDNVGSEDDSDDEYFDVEESDLSLQGGVYRIGSLMPKLKEGNQLILQYIQDSNKNQGDFTSLYFLLNPTQLSYQSILKKIVQWISLDYCHSIFRIGFKIILSISGVPKQDRVFSIKKTSDEVLNTSYRKINVIIQDIIKLIPTLEERLKQSPQHKDIEEIDGGKYFKNTQQFNKKNFYLTGGSILDIILQSKELMKYWLTRIPNFWLVEKLNSEVLKYKKDPNPAIELPQKYSSLKNYYNLEESQIIDELKTKVNQNEISNNQVIITSQEQINFPAYYIWNNISDSAFSNKSVYLFYNPSNLDMTLGSIRLSFDMNKILDLIITTLEIDFDLLYYLATNFYSSNNEINTIISGLSLVSSKSSDTQKNSEYMIFINFIEDLFKTEFTEDFKIAIGKPLMLVLVSLVQTLIHIFSFSLETNKIFSGLIKYCSGIILNCSFNLSDLLDTFYEYKLTVGFQKELYQNFKFSHKYDLSEILLFLYFISCKAANNKFILQKIILSDEIEKLKKYDFYLFLIIDNLFKLGQNLLKLSRNSIIHDVKMEVVDGGCIGNLKTNRKYKLIKKISKHKYTKNLKKSLKGSSQNQHSHKKLLITSNLKNSLRRRPNTKHISSAKIKRIVMNKSKRSSKK